MHEISIAKKKKQVCNWIALAEIAAILIIAFQALSPSLGQTQLEGGKTYTFTCPDPHDGDIYGYLWSATNGTPQTSINSSFLWTAPKVGLPTPVVVSLDVRNDATSCSNKSELDLIIIPASIPYPPPGESKISLKKNCIYTSPVRVGDLIIYTYNVTNVGSFPLTDINLTDIADWGPDCHPVYVKGDNGNETLDPGETWWYECKYAVPDPSDYQVSNKIV